MRGLHTRESRGKREWECERTSGDEMFSAIHSWLWFWADKTCMMKYIYIKANKHCDCDTITLVIGDSRPMFVSLVTTIILDIPWVEVIFFNWEDWPATVFVLTWALTDNFLVLLLYLCFTTNQRSIPFGYFLHLMVQGHQGPFLFFMESIQFVPGMLKDQETVNQEFS